MYESQFEEDLYQLRREKLKQIAEIGKRAGLTYGASTYPNSYAFTTTIPELRAAHDGSTGEQLEAEKIETSIAGRIMAIRVQGKAGFAQLQQNGARMQLYVRKDDVGDDAFALYKLLDLGDHIGVTGYLMRTRTGELTVHVRTLTFLTKAMLALPDKYHGLEDTELRYRQRYVDLFMNTGHGVKPAEGKAAEESLNVRETFVKRAAVLRALRKFFDSRGYLEVETPMLHTIAGGAAARPFKTHHNALDIPLSLRIAPELYLKRLVVGGMDRVYEINRNFRNEGVSTRHNPEFTMLEFYQAYANYHDLMDLTQELVTFVATEVNGSTTANFNGIEIDLSNWSKLSMKDAIIKWWPDWLGGPPRHSDLSNPGAFFTFFRSELNTEKTDPISLNLVDWSKLSSSVRDSDQDRDFDKDMGSNDDGVYSALAIWFARINTGELAGKLISELFEILAEPHLIQPTIIYDFPLAVSPLSKVKPDEPDWVERFEFYIGGFEVGNAFSELNDPDDQRRRFEDQLKERDRGDDEAHQMDEDYVRALGYGLPPTAGEGIGIDRLTMILTGAKSIRDVILFPLMRPPAKAATEPDLK